MDRALKKIDMASKTTDKLAQSIQIMDQLKKVQLNPVMDRSKLEESLNLANFRNSVAPKMHAVRLANDKAEN
jgi:glutamine synthetase type III